MCSSKDCQWQAIPGRPYHATRPSQGYSRCHEIFALSAVDVPTAAVDAPRGMRQYVTPDSPEPPETRLPPSPANVFMPTSTFKSGNTDMLAVGRKLPVHVRQVLPT